MKMLEKIRLCVDYATIIAGLKMVTEAYAEFVKTGAADYTVWFTVDLFLKTPIL